MLSDEELADPLSTLERLVEQNRVIHEVECVNLNPAANVMNPAAEALLAATLGTRPSLGDPGDKYEMGLEAVERIEVLAADLARRVFRARFVELRVPSGAIANLYVFLAAGRPGAGIIAPPASVAGHVTHHLAGAAGLSGLVVHAAPIDAARYSVDVDGVAALARSVRPAIITVGASLNLRHHPVAALREVADEVGAVLMFDAAHLAGLIAGGVWPSPLDEGAHAMTMSTYKSLAGPPAGLVATNDPELAGRLGEIAYPGLTANFDVGNTAALARTLVDWERVGASYAAEMTASASALAEELTRHGLPVHVPDVDDALGATESHAFALDAGAVGGGHATAVRLRGANLLTSAIGLPGDDDLARGVRVGTNELVRWGMTGVHMAELGRLLAAAWTAEEDRLPSVAAEVSAFRRPFDQVCFTS